MVAAMNRIPIIIILLIAALIVIGGAFAEEQEAESGEEIKWQVISAGGHNDCSSTDFRVAGTLGQIAVDHSSSADFGHGPGFWPASGSGSEFVCGDANGSGYVDIDDIVFIVSYIFAGGPAPEPLEVGNANCLESVDIDDIVYLVNYVFGGGSEPCDPNGDEVPDC